MFKLTQIHVFAMKVQWNVSVEKAQLPKTKTRRVVLVFIFCAHTLESLGAADVAQLDWLAEASFSSLELLEAVSTIDQNLSPVDFLGFFCFAVSLSQSWL